jgi:myo-inositol-1(or 4)-monophosphatase
MLKKSELLKIKKIAIEAAHEAGALQLKYFRKRLDVREKARSSLVTEVDLRSEALIKKKLEKNFPDFQFLGEESGEMVGRQKSAPMWHVDPLDGTTNFVHGFPMFCVSIGLAIGNEPVLGVIYIPTLNETFHGAKGIGASLNRKTIQVSKRSKLSESLLTTGFAYLKEAKRLSPEIRKFEKAHVEARAVRRPGAAAIDMAYVSCGIFDGFWERNLSSWDICAGTVLIREAGGLVTDYHGKPFELDGREVLASNGKIHEAMEQFLIK